MKTRHYILLLIGFGLALFFSAHEFKTVKDRLRPEYYVGNISNGLKPYLVAITYYDGRPNDTVLVYYGYEPGSRSIYVWGTQGAYGSHQVPQFWSSNVFTDSTIIYLGVKEVKILENVYQRSI